MDDFHMKLIDVHCHLQDTAFDKDRDQVIARAKSASVAGVIVSTLDLDDANRTLTLLKPYEGFTHVSVGCDPSNLDSDEVAGIQELIRSNRTEIVAIGEIGLDYYHIERDQREKQVEIFRSWIRFAREMDMPLVVHSRSAGKYAIDILLDEGYHRVLMHAYDGKVGWALKAVAKGFYFSIPPSIMHSRQKEKLVNALDTERLMLESDSPVLGPVRSERNEPSNIEYSLKRIAEIKGIPEEEVAEVTTQNATRLFFPQRSRRPL
jgi:TatD DNase family protein